MSVRFAVLGMDDESERIAGWLADEGQVVRRLADAGALSAFDPAERFDWVIADATLRDGCLGALQRRPAHVTRCLFIGDRASDDAGAAVTMLTRPLRRRMLLSAVRAGAATQVRGTK